MPHTITIPNTAIVLLPPINSSSNLNAFPVACSLTIGLPRDILPIDERLPPELSPVFQLVLSLGTHDRGLNIRCPVMALTVAVKVVVAAAAVILGSGAVVRGEEAREGL